MAAAAGSWPDECGRPGLSLRAPRLVPGAEAPGRCVVDRATLHIHDYGEAFDTEFAEHARRIRQGGGGPPDHLTMLMAPLLRDGVALGAISVRRGEVRPFSTREIAPGTCPSLYARVSTSTSTTRILSSFACLSTQSVLTNISGCA